MSRLDIRTNNQARSAALATIDALARAAAQGDQVAIITRTALGTEARQLDGATPDGPVDPARLDRILRHIERVDEIADPVRLADVVASTAPRSSSPAPGPMPALAPSSSGGGAPAIVLVVVVLVAALLLTGALDV